MFQILVRNPAEEMQECMRQWGITDLVEMVINDRSASLSQVANTIVGLTLTEWILRLPVLRHAQDERSELLSPPGAFPLGQEPGQVAAGHRAENVTSRLGLNRHNGSREGAVFPPNDGSGRKEVNREGEGFAFYGQLAGRVVAVLEDARGDRRGCVARRHDLVGV